MANRYMCGRVLIFLAGWALATSASLSAQPKDITGWGKIKWGMDAAAVKAAYGDEVHSVSERIGDIVTNELRVSNINIGKLTVEASIPISPSGPVEFVYLNPTEDMQTSKTLRVFVFETFKTMLIEKYGPPVDQDVKPDSRKSTRTVLWRFPSTSITLTWSEYQETNVGYVNIQYKPVDKKSLNQL